MPGRVRLYGPTVGEHSYAQVTRGMARALSAARELADVCPLGRDAPDASECHDGAAAAVSLNCGDPQGLLHAHRMGQHRSHWLLLAPNGETLPRGLIENLTEPSKVLPRGMLTGGFLAPSAWAAGVLRRAAPGLPVVVAPHGVTPEVHQPDPTRHDTARIGFERLNLFNVLHMTSSETERKGTKLLLRAWRHAKLAQLLPRKALLLVMMNPTATNTIRWWAQEEQLRMGEDIVVMPGLANDQRAVAGLYQGVHAICQPSRGEGFGLVPLEALACGTPIIATACTGHSEFLGTPPPGAVIIEHGPIAPMNDFAGSLAPTVTVEAIVSGLVVAYQRWESLAIAAKQHALALAREWSWENKNGLAIRRMLEESEKNV